MTLPPQLQKAFNTFDAQTLRERLLVTGVILALLWMLWDNMLMQPINTLEKAREAQLTSRSKQVQDLRLSLQQLTPSHPDHPVDPDAGNRQRLIEIQVASAALDKRLNTATTDLIKPGEMAPLLESVLAQAGNLKLVKMQTMNPEAPDAKTGGDGYYRQGLSVEVRGGYLDAVHYLQALENMPWKISWDSVKIEVINYPISHITILVHTLGFKAGDSGV